MGLTHFFFSVGFGYHWQAKHCFRFIIPRSLREELFIWDGWMVFTRTCYYSALTLSVPFERPNTIFLLGSFASRSLVTWCLSCVDTRRTCLAGALQRPPRGFAVSCAECRASSCLSLRHACLRWLARVVPVCWDIRRAMTVLDMGGYYLAKVCSNASSACLRMSLIIIT